ncbi:tyrosine-type recombinase/integrase [Frankia sp. AgW1.1]|uniref:tyrosine-type recombinase/integrase n=1 Tax=Frankia sp. AgW1.1 TaxID=1836971 RepID=UPI001934ACF3|nr:tyrosine-type recombinase/integrase [Frankia sp. AgW1.1]MBL7487129.1 tyrosine-type recombinase/integrase [Frankia sp. AgW1.1]
MLVGEVLPASLTRAALALTDDTDPWVQVVHLFLVGYAANTRAGYERDLADWADWCAHLGVAPLDAHRAHVDLWVRHLTEDLGRERSTVNRKLSAVAGAYRYAVADDVVDNSPVEHIRRPRVDDESQTTGLSREQAAHLRAIAKVDGPRSRALIDVLVLNGLRISEALSIRIEEIRDEGGHQVATITRKGGKKRLVPFGPAVLASFAACAKGRTEGPMFGDLDRHNAYTLVLRLARRAGFRVTPHGLRHTWVTLSRKAGIPLEDVQDAAGHADPRTTRRYDRARHQLDSHPTYRLSAFIGEDSSVIGEP